MVFHLLLSYCLPIMQKTWYLEGMQLFYGPNFGVSFIQLDSIYGIISCVYVLDLDHISVFCTPCNMANKILGTRNLDLSRIMSGDGDKICTLFCLWYMLVEGPHVEGVNFLLVEPTQKPRTIILFSSSFSWF